MDYECYQNCKQYIHVTQIRGVLEYNDPDFIKENLCVNVQGSVLLFHTYSKQHPKEFVCTCGWMDEYKREESEYGRIDEMDTHCKCKYEAFKRHPIYVIVDINKKFHYVHPCEREHMERYLAGTDDPMYDLVHELRYNPTFGFETRAAEADFKKRKINEDE